MNQNALSVLFYLNKAKINKQGLCPIKCRLTYFKARKEFSTGEFISPKNWNSKLQKASNNEPLNIQLEIIKTNIRRSFLGLQIDQISFGVEEIFKSYTGEPLNNNRYFLQYFKEFLDKKKELIGIDLQQSTWKKFEYAQIQFEEFLKYKLNKKDLKMYDLKIQLLNDFEHFLKTVRKQRQVTVNKTIQRLRKPIKEAINEGYLESDPFMSFKPGKVIKEVVFLTDCELKILENHEFYQPRLSLIKDLFIFCCYTGLSYCEMSDLKKNHIVLGFDGNQWIQMKRKKTNKIISVPLLPKAKAILAKYDEVGEFSLPRISNQKLNSYLKEIGSILGINKSISHHTARKTFASTVLLYNDVPMEIVSELLGHSSMKITQEYYGKVVQKRISEEMNRISLKTF
ncbi:hypothetical protein LCGC14_0354360 [marine sediment metagenome]|uniref:Tyr recombinase domain-containing protein n=1 Tax=marine sediment metagenome TaxID=412755 RepID=A0A0F9VX17_9ZZZZ|nr:site-specific integrase [Maribacter sp.]HDZ04670.1 site-specific integrase [Maribacter sp.]